MGSKSASTKMEEVRLSYDAAVLLRQIADGICQREFAMVSEDEEVFIDVPGEVKVKFALKEKDKKDGVKTKLKVELVWFTPDCELSEECVCGCECDCECDAEPETEE